jgi:hypothetical protein
MIYRFRSEVNGKEVYTQFKPNGQGDMSIVQGSKENRTGFSAYQSFPRSLFMLMLRYCHDTNNRDFPETLLSLDLPAHVGNWPDSSCELELGVDFSLFRTASSPISIPINFGDSGTLSYDDLILQIQPASFLPPLVYDRSGVQKFMRLIMKVAANGKIRVLKSELEERINHYIEHYRDS